MYRTFKTLFIAFLLTSLFTSNLPLPVGAQATPLSGNFRVTLTGFHVNHQTVDDALNRDGWGDEVTMIHQVAVIDSAGGFHQLIAPGAFSSVMGQTPPNAVRAGRGSDRGGLVTGDSHPTTTPWIVSTPIISGNPPNILFEGTLTQRSNAVLIVPTIWEVDGDVRLQGDYATKISQAKVAETNAVRAMISATPPLTTGPFVLPGAALGIGNTVILGRGFLGLGDPKNRPIGMSVLGDSFGFTPQAIVLTYDVARELARRVTNPTFGRGVVEVRYRESDGLLQGDYSLFLKIEDLTYSSGAACAPVTASFRGSAQMTTSHPDVRLRGPFPASLAFNVQFSDCRSVVSIPEFPAITTPTIIVSPGVTNTATVTRTDNSAGSFTPSTGRLSIPMTLRMTHTHPFAGASTISITLSTDGGAPLDASGNITLVGSGRFRAGFFDGQEARFVVRGTLSPNPRP